MRAATYSQTGRAADVLVVSDMDRPEPGPGEVRIRLAWSGVNPSDVKSRAGVRSKTLPFPCIVPHSDGSGVIDAVGEGVARNRVGERVWVWNAGWGRAFGTAAQWVVLPSAQAVPLPEDTDMEIGALLGIPALTAYHAVHMKGGVAGKRVLVAGGAGAVGRYAIQMAKLAGARQVIATVSSDDKAALARSAGADTIIDYRQQEVVEALLSASEGKGVDRVIEVDFAANAQQDFAGMAPEGDIVVYGSGSPEISVPFVPGILKNISVHFFIVYNLAPEARAAAISGLTELLAANRLEHNIAARFALADIAAAHELVESGKAVGSVIVALDE